MPRPAAGERQPAEAAEDFSEQAEAEHEQRRRDGVELRPLRETTPTTASPLRTVAGDRCCSNSFSRQWRISFGSGMRTGQTSSQRPQKVEAFGRCFAFSMPINAGVSTAPIGPG